jgi:hypothetical protein
MITIQQRPQAEARSTRWRIDEIKGVRPLCFGLTLW